jgi:hypothetical protein
LGDSILGIGAATCDDHLKTGTAEDVLGPETEGLCLGARGLVLVGGGRWGDVLRGRWLR